MTKRIFRIYQLSIASLLSLGLSFGTSRPTLAQNSSTRFPGATIGGGTRGGSPSASNSNRWPGTRIGGGTRGPGCIHFPEGFASLSSQEKVSLQQSLQWNLIALMPESNLGETIADYPTLMWFMPSTNASYLEVSLYKADDRLYQDKLIYRASLRITGQPGVASLTIPQDAGIPPLEVGQNYLWSLQMICESDEETKDPALVSDLLTPGFTVSGVIQRVAPDQALVNRVAQSDSATQASLYLQEGLWWDALGSMVDFYCEAKDNPVQLEVFDQGWQEILTSVGLGTIAGQQLMHQCHQDVATIHDSSVSSVQP